MPRLSVSFLPCPSPPCSPTLSLPPAPRRARIADAGEVPDGSACKVLTPRPNGGSSTTGLGPVRCRRRRNHLDLACSSSTSSGRCRTRSTHVEGAKPRYRDAGLYKESGAPASKRRPLLAPRLPTRARRCRSRSTSAAYFQPRSPHARRPGRQGQRDQPDRPLVHRPGGVPAQPRPDRPLRRPKPRQVDPLRQPVCGTQIVQPALAIFVDVIVDSFRRSSTWISSTRQQLLPVERDLPAARPTRVRTPDDEPCWTGSPRQRRVRQPRVG